MSLGPQPASMLDRITPLILTFNEAPNIGRTLERVSWAKDLVVVDSFSQDDTAQIVGRFPNARLFHRAFDQHARQWSYGVAETGIATEWILALDADYLLPEELVREMAALAPAADVAGYRASFRYCVHGRPLRATVYPPVTVLYRKSMAKYVQDGHTQRVELTGRILDLDNSIYHDDRKPLHHWLVAQSRYMRLEAEKLQQTRSPLRFKDRLRRMIVVAPVAMFVYTLFVKGNVLDGRAGFHYAMQRTLAEAMLSLYLLEAALGSKPPAK